MSKITYVSVVYYVGTPFVHLIKTPMGHYFYDVNTSAIVSVDEETYLMLEDVQNGGVDFADISQNAKIRVLFGDGLLSSKRIQRIKHPMSDRYEHLLENNVGYIILQVTQRCNFRCEYCVYSESHIANRSHSNRDMSIDVAKKAIDFLVEHSRGVEEIELGFYGGEPLLRYDFIKECMAYARARAFGKSVRFFITTNGSLLTKEIAQDFIGHNGNITVSLDGPPDVHDKHRTWARGSGTFETIFKNLESIKAECPECFDKISYNAVLNPENDLCAVNNIFDYELFKDSAFQFAPVNSYGAEPADYSEYIETFVYEYFKATLHKMGRIKNPAHINNVLLHRLDTVRGLFKRFSERTDELPDEMHHSGPCIPGITRLFADVNGNFLPCERVNENSNCMIIGNVDEGFDYDKAYSLLNIGELTADACKSCWAVRLCTSCCRFCDDGDKLSAAKKSEQCADILRNKAQDLAEYIAYFETQPHISGRARRVCEAVEGGV